MSGNYKGMLHTLSILLATVLLDCCEVAVLKTYLGNHCVMKSLSDTRWETHAVATTEILESYSKIAGGLENIAEDQSQKGETI